MENFVSVRELSVKYNAGTEIELCKDATLNTSRLMSEAFRKIFNPDTIDYKEAFHVIFLDNGLKPIAHAKIADGGLDAVHVDVRLIFSQALIIGAVNVVVAHNHPSNTRTPSQADRALTKKMVEGGKILDIKVIDHIILTPINGYTSFADEGLI